MSGEDRQVLEYVFVYAWPFAMVLWFGLGVLFSLDPPRPLLRDPPDSTIYKILHQAWPAQNHVRGRDDCAWGLGPARRQTRRP